MFANNVFRNNVISSTFSYTSHDDEIDQDQMWEFRQLYPVYTAFTAFLNSERFDGEKLESCVGKTFVDGLLRRLDGSRMEAERDLAKCILLKLFDRALHAREYIVRGTIDSLENYDVTSIASGAEKELLEIFDILMRHGLVESATITKVVKLRV